MLSKVVGLGSGLRDEFLARETFYWLKEVKILTERWRKSCNTARPHTVLGYCQRHRSPSFLEIKFRPHLLYKRYRSGAKSNA